MLGSRNLVCYLPRLKPLTVLELPWVMPRGGVGVKMYNRSDFTFKVTLTFMSEFLLEVITWVPFMLGSLKFRMLLTQA